MQCCPLALANGNETDNKFKFIAVPFMARFKNVLCGFSQIIVKYLKL